MIRKFNPEGVVASEFYSQGVEVTSFQRMLFISGQVGIGPDGSLATPPPATTLVIVKALTSPALLVEIEATAVK